MRCASSPAGPDGCGADLARSALPVAVGLCLPAAAPIDGQSGGRERVLLESFEFSKTRGHAIGAPRFDHRSARGAARDHLAAHRGVDCCQHRLCLLRTNQRPPRTFVAAKPHGSAYLRRRPRAGSRDAPDATTLPRDRRRFSRPGNARRPNPDRRRDPPGNRPRVINQRPAAISAPFTNDDPPMLRERAVDARGQSHSRDRTPRELLSDGISKTRTCAQVQ